MQMFSIFETVFLPSSDNKTVVDNYYIGIKEGSRLDEHCVNCKGLILFIYSLTGHIRKPTSQSKKDNLLLGISNR